MEEFAMSGLFAGTPLERPVTCEVCLKPRDECGCPRSAEGDVCRPKDQRAVVRLEKRKGGRVMTVIGGLDPVASDLPDLVKRLKSACAAGGGVTEDGAEVQGDHREVAANLLRAAGYPVTVR